MFSFYKSLLLGTLSLSCLTAENDRHPEYEPIGGNNSGGVSSDSSNIFAHAKTTASGNFDNDTPDKAVDGNIDAKNYWGCEKLPVWHKIDLEKSQSLSQIIVFPYWEDGRIYQYKIEGSLDDKKWFPLVNQTSNSISGTKDGFNFTIPPRSVRYVRTTFTGNNKGTASGGHLVEIQGFAKAKESKLEGSALNINYLYPYQGTPEQDKLLPAVEEQAWRGERVNGRAAFWAANSLNDLQLKTIALKNAHGQSIPLHASFLRYTMAGGKLVADIIDTNKKTIELPANTTRSVWIWADIPANCATGIYKGEVIAQAGSKNEVKIPVNINVLPAVLPAPKNWKFYLDIWQHPEAVARYHDVEAWSPEHFALLKPIMQRLAEAGQKTITTSLVGEAWGGQTYDWFPSMIEWKKLANGKWTYDYSNFDKYVNFMKNEVGIKGDIICYSMTPWKMQLHHWDETSASHQIAQLDINNSSFDTIWGNFLKDFTAHLKQKGWLETTRIGIDERDDKEVSAARKTIEKYAPGLKMVFAVNRASDKNDFVYHISPILTSAQNIISGDLLKNRQKEGKITTFYVCVHPKKPNTFTASPLAEAEWLGIFAAANNLDGFLRWAYNSWGRNPFQTSDFGNWPSGDCFLVYPGNLSTPRWERLRDGIEDAEKIRILRNMAQKPQAKAAFKTAVEEMNTLLKGKFTIENSQGSAHIDDVHAAKEAILKTTKSAL